MTEASDDQARTAEVVAGLVRLIREAPDEVIQSVAYGDSYEDEDGCRKSLIALRQVLDELECRLDRQPDNFWHPREPVELVSYGADGQGGHDTAVANALLMISDLETGEQDYMSFRWQQSPGAAFFEALPPRLGAPLLAGFEILRARWELEDWWCRR